MINERKKCLHICTIDKGGAFNGAKRLNEMLTEHGIESKIIVRTKIDDASPAICAFDSPLQGLVSKVKNAINLLYKKGDVKRDILGTDLTSNPLVKEADVIFIHWISTFLSPKQIYELTTIKGKKVIFWMHDMWLFTGGCHVDRRCGGYASECRDCPMAGKYASKSFRRKKEYIKKADMTVCGPSRWIVEEAKKSSILEGKKIEYIPNTYDDRIFNSECDRVSIRKELGLSLDKRLILFGAADTGTANDDKGFSYLIKAIKQLDMTDKQLVVIGNSDGAKEILKEYDAVFLGYISDEKRLADIYRSVDVFVNPSLQESFGYTVCESMACGTPAVAFSVGGMLDQIEHMVNGYLAGFKNSDELALGIDYCLNNREKLSKKASESARRFSYDKAYKYICELLTGI